jgi:maleamate amidohydrolase
MTASLQDDYQRAGFGGTLPFGQRPALLVIDVVQAYVQPDSPLFAQGFVDALAPNVRLIEAARAAGVPVVFTNVVYGAEGRDGGLFYRKVPALSAFLEGAPGGAFPASLRPTHDEVVVTMWGDVFHPGVLQATAVPGLVRALHDPATPPVLRVEGDDHAVQ